MSFWLRLISGCEVLGEMFNASSNIRVDHRTCMVSRIVVRTACSYRIDLPSHRIRLHFVIFKAHRYKSFYMQLASFFVAG